MASPSLTAGEREALNLTTSLWAALIDLPIEHAEDVGDFRRMIHDIQARILARPARRDLHAGRAHSE